MNVRVERFGSRKRSWLLGTAMLALGGASAHAQTVSPTDADGIVSEAASEAPPSEIVVTASRIARSGFAAPTPTTVVGSAQLETRGATNVAQVLNEIPSFKATQNPQTAGIIQRTPSANYVDLRGLGSSRTLVLVDGRRFVPQIQSLPGYQVDLNQVPALLVDRVEVVTGGASAQWGSDAVAGVVNIILKKDFEGINAEAQAGVSEKGDNKSHRFGLLAGRNFGDDRGNVTFGFDYERNYGVGDVNTRDWGRDHYSITANPCPLSAAVSANCPTGGNGQPQQLILPDVQFAVHAPGGVINNTALRGTTFLPGGTPVPFQYGQYVGTTNMIGGGQPGINFSNQQDIVAQYRRWGSYGRVSYDLSDTVTGFGEASYSYSRGGGSATASRNAAYVIRTDNPFIPAALRSRIDALNSTLPANQRITSFNLGRANYDIGTARGDAKNTTFRLVGGLEGTISDAGNWKWDASANYGRNRFQLRIPNNLVLANMTAAVDAVTGPTGTPVCRSSIAGQATVPFAAPGCVPINLFGEGAPSQPAIDYVLGELDAVTIYRQVAAAANISGEPFSTWAGPASLAFGVEYRREYQNTQVDPIAERTGYEGNNVRSTYGRFSVKEGYVETVIPLARDLPFAQALDLNGAVRYADYSTSAGGQTTWKIGGTYTPTSGVLFRITRSRDIRAPNIYELNSPGTVTQPTIVYGTQQVTARQNSSGNPTLKPEKADTFSGGVSLSPGFLPGFRLSIDYYSIKLKGLIASLTAQQVANYCTQGNVQAYCSLITLNAAGAPTDVQSPLLNLAQVKVSGIDIQSAYRVPVDGFGVLTFGFNGNYAIDADVNTGALNAPVIDRVGEVGPGNLYSTPRFRGTASVNLKTGPVDLNAQLRIVGKGKYDVTFVEGVNINDNTISSQKYLDLSATLSVSQRFELFGVINNALDNDPPAAPSALVFPTNPIYYDMVGRTFRFGARVKF